MNHGSHIQQCKVCQYGPEKIDWENLSNMGIGRLLGINDKSVGRHKKYAKSHGFEPWEPFTVASDDRPVDLKLRREWEAQTKDGVVTLRSYENVADGDTFPLWPVIDKPAVLYSEKPVAAVPLVRKWKTAVVGADTQIGFRRFDDGTVDPFHDDAAMALFTKIVEIENPDRTIVAGDIMDMTSQGKYAQEASFANTTQMSLDRTYGFGFGIREVTGGEIEWIEGNHDKRLQNFVEMNALAAFGLRKAGLPDSWPVMSLPNLLRLDELDITYYDSYPNAHVWINDVLRAEHGTRANSKGSTAAQYLNDTPHVSRVVGHTHRSELVQKTTWDRMGKIRSQVVNPGCLCRVDGAVPSVHCSIGADGKPATVYEDWQQGAAVIRYTDKEFFTELVQFEDGHTVYQGQELTA